MYKESVVQQSQAESSNIGAITNVVSNVALTLGSIGAIAGGSAITKNAIAGGGANAIENANLGMQIQKMGVQMIGRQIGGFSGIVVSSNMADAYQSYNYKEQLTDMLEERNQKQKEEKAFAMMPMNLIKKNWGKAGQMLKEEKRKNEMGGNE